MKIDDSFPTVFWGKDKSTKAQFCPCEEIFDSSLVTSCMVCAVHENKILLAKPPRGWGFARWPYGIRRNTRRLCAARGV